MKTTLKTRQEFDIALDKALNAATAYYDGLEMNMTDAEYDVLIEDIEQAVESNPDWDSKGVLDQVAAGASKGGDVIHPEPMLSLGKVKENSDIVSFVNKMKVDIDVEVKLDGLAVRAEYKAGVLSLVATRGDGNTGEDVTAQSLKIDGLPKKLNKKITCEVRGEIFMTDVDFEIASANRVKSGKSPFVNPRNATAGSLRNTDSEYFAPMTFAAYDASGGLFDAIDSHIGRLEEASKLGVKTTSDLFPELNRSVSTSKDVLKAVALIGEKRSTLGFPIDGAVIKIDQISKRAELGAISRTPRWAVAFKYAPDTAMTVLKDIEVAVGRTGRISLTGILEPVFVGGVTIERATLHHPQWINDADIRVGGMVYVYRAGDVIPRISAPVLSKRTDKDKVWVAPAVCPQCGEAWDKSSLLWRCPSPECSLNSWIDFAMSRDVLDVDGASVAFADAAVESGLVSDLADLFTLTIDQVAKLPAGDDREIGVKNATKIVNGIQKAKNQPLARIVTSLNIRKMGRTLGRRVVAHFGTLEALRKASEAQLSEVDGIGSEKARYIYNGFKERSAMIDRMIALGINVGEPLEASASLSSGSKPLAGKKVVVTGTVPGLTRTQAQEAVEKLGGVSSGSVSKSTDLVVVGDGAGSKADKATELGITIMSAEDFAALFNAN
jgi:DNA ligase (NAD+)